jgi:sialic acid synthase SpsE
MGSMVDIIAEIGINHNGSMEKAMQMVFDAYNSGCKIVKFQCHIPEEEMLPNNIIPSNANESIWNMMKRCALTEEQDRILKDGIENMDMHYLSTPFSMAAVDRLERLGVDMYKIGSGECNNYPLIRYVVSTGKPVILSTGMNDWDTVDEAVDIIGKQLEIILHCVSMYPTPYEMVNLPRMLELKERYGKPVGLSDHSVGIYTALAAVALGARVVEKHFTSDKTWQGADIPISIDPGELRELVEGCAAIKAARQKSQPDDAGTREFAFASVVSTIDIHVGDVLSTTNIGVKRPGTGEIKAALYDFVIGKQATRYIPKDKQLCWTDFVEIAHSERWNKP